MFAAQPRAKRADNEHENRSVFVTEPKPTAPLEGPFCLSGPVQWPDKGTLPLRRDLAHIALAKQFLVANYAEPTIMHIGSDPAPLIRSTKSEDDVIETLEAGAAFQALDVTTSWVWGCLGPEGPSGYVKRTAFT